MKLLKIVFVLAIGSGIFLVTPAGKNFQAKAVSVLNPAVAERRSITEAREKILLVNKEISTSVGNNLSSTQKLTIKNALSSIESSLDEVEKTIDQNDLVAGISSLINKAIPEKDSPSNICPN